MSEGERRLVAVMFTDIVGFTSLAQEDEHAALDLLDRHRKLIRPVFAKHAGHEVKTMGDAFLVQFPSALEATLCAIDVQNTIHSRNLERGGQVQIRIGIHAGDVMVQGGDILGDTVNVASRIEQIAEPGGICISEQVQIQIKDKVSYQLVGLGPSELKNVREPVNVFKVVLPWETKRSQDLATLKLDPRRVAILPLANISQSSEDEYFADGMTEELISTLSRIAGLKVISRTSVMRYKGLGKSAAEIAGELKVGTILEGSVRKAGANLRIAAQLIDARSDEHLWSQDYDRTLEDVFAIQREIAQKVADELSITLLSGEKEDMERRVTENTAAHVLYLKGRYLWNERSEEANDKAVRYFEEAIKLDPKFALAYSALADCFTFYGAFGWLKPEDSFPMAKEYALKSLEIDPRLAEPHTTLADVLNSYEGKWEQSETEFKRAIKLNPNYSTAHMWYGLLLMFLRRFEEAREQIRLAVELDPLSRVGSMNLAGVSRYSGNPRDAVRELESALKTDPDFAYLHGELGWAYCLDSRTEDGISELEKAVDMTHGDPQLKADLACVLGFSGRREEASAILREVQEASKVKHVSKMKLAQVFFAIGKNDDAFSLLEEALKDHSLFTMGGSYLLDIRLGPWFAQVREDSRWDVFVRRLGIPQS